MINPMYVFVAKSLVRNPSPNHKIAWGKFIPFYNVVSRNTFKQKKGGRGMKMTYN